MWLYPIRYAGEMFQNKRIAQMFDTKSVLAPGLKVQDAAFQNCSAVSKEKSCVLAQETDTEGDPQGWVSMNDTQEIKGLRSHEQVAWQRTMHQMLRVGRT